ncbi:efflux RND transporter periplasmic adaptor subunit [Aurantimonas sp. A2-1-M11]|uniref:efflux RND transporter periplasmic adaptor subunit n=1 Tax=Aurantimonas sp. A2-1-M11 TaxID=3113712 RepID=UPI002F928CDA
MFLRPLVLLLAAAAVMSPITAIGQEAPVATAQPQAPSVSVVEATRREIVSTVTVTGTLRPREMVVVGSDVEGLRIEALLADEGDTVSAGDVLARLDTEMIEIDLARNESQTARAEAAIAQARSRILEAESIATEAQSALARTRPLAQKGIVGQDVLDQRVSAAASADAALASARQGVAVAEADKALTFAERRELELRRSKAEIKAPTDGLILSRAARLGSVVSAASGSLFEMARDGLIELDADVGETALRNLAEGQAVTVTLPGGGDTIDGTIRLVSPLVDATTRLGQIRVALPTSPDLRSGSFARGVVEIARSSGIVVPRTAIIADADKAVVQVVRDGMIETRAVTLGITTGSDAEILKGLDAGDAVVALAGTFVRDGDTVTPVPLRTAEIEG